MVPNEIYTVPTLTAEPKHDPNYEPGKPELIFDPDTKTYGILVDHVQVIAGLDPVGMRKRVYHDAWAARDATESSGDEGGSGG